MKTIKILRIAQLAHLAIWTMIALALIISVTMEWAKNGCELWQLLVGMVFYVSCCLGIFIAGHLQFNETIKEMEDHGNV